MGPLLKYPLLAFTVLALGFLGMGKEHRFLEINAPFFTDHFIELR
jgi:hypothetical protein